MEDMWTRIAGDLIDRLSGPMKFRLLLQPKRTNAKVTAPSPAARTAKTHTV